MARPPKPPSAPISTTSATPANETRAPRSISGVNSSLPMAAATRAVMIGVAATSSAESAAVVWPSAVVHRAW